MKNPKPQILFFLTILLTLFYIHSCKKLDIKRIMAVRTDTVIVSNTTVTAKGTIIDLGQGITDYGFCWATTTKPTINDNKTSHGSASETGSFTDTLTNLLPNTAYYLMAYAANSKETFYSKEINFTTKNFTPTVTTTAVTSITYNSAYSGGNVTNDGGATVTIRGVCWNTSPNPTIASNHTTDGSGTGIFTSSITGLSPNIDYYVRAYAINNIGTGYGNEISFKTSCISPSVTSQPSNQSISDGGNANFSVTATGTGLTYQWQENNGGGWIDISNGGSNPAYSNAATNTLTLTNVPLSFDTYDYRCIVSGTCSPSATSNSANLTVTFLCGTSTVTDIDGNIYNTVLIGSQCWLKENMRTKKYPGGGTITKGPSAHGAAGWDTDNAYYSCPPNSSNNGEDCAAAASLGMLYQWSAAMNGSTTPGEQGICPDGWHIPTHSEWTTLERQICNDNGGGSCNTDFPDDVTTIEWLGSNGEGSALAGNVSAQSWNTGTLTSDSHFGNSGLVVGPSGHRNTDGKYYSRGDTPLLWSSTEYGTSAWRRHLSFSSAQVHRGIDIKTNGRSVRCVQDY